MATLEELSSLYNEGTLIKKISAALIIKANDILVNIATSTPEQKAWAARAFASPHQEAHRVLKVVLADNASASVAQIKSASDVSIQNNVNDAVQLFIDADAGA